MNVVIIEDEMLTARRLEKLLTTLDPAIRVMTSLQSVAGAVAWLGSQPADALPDLIFMDIHLEDDIAFRIIDELKLTIPIIFTTAYDNYAIQAFKANSIDYLLKPVDEDELSTAIDKFRQLRLPASRPAAPQPDYTALMNLLQKSAPADFKDRFMVSLGPKINSIPTTDIAYFFYEDRSTWLTTHEGQRYPIEYSLDKLITMLDPKHFFRVNRAFLVALPAIRSIVTYSASKLKLELKPAAREDVFVSGDRMTDFKEWLGK